MADTKYERICTICGTKFEFCPRGCGKFQRMEPWHDSYDRKNCMILYNVCAGFVNGWKSPEEEAARLKDLDLSYVDKLAPWMQEAITEMQKIDGKIVVNDVLESNITEAVIEESNNNKPKEKSEDNADKIIKSSEVKEVNDTVKSSEAKFDRKSNTKTSRPKYYTKNK